MKRVYPEPNTGCWIWAGREHSDGYGAVHSKSSNGFTKAHRLSYFLHYGEFDRLLLVCHKCDNRMCVNPDHLYLGTVQQNNKDRDDRKRRNPVGHKNGRSVLTNAEVLSIRQQRGAGETLRQLAIEYNVSESTMYLVCSRKSWTHI